MKGKRLFAILGVLIFLTVLIVVNSTIFTLHDVKINWLTTKYKLEDTKDSDLTEYVELGQNIFLVKKDEIVKKLEEKFYYLRVVSIETKFPNKLVVHTAEREALYAVRITDKDYAILDEMGKVLEKTDDDSMFKGSEAYLGTRPIRILFSNGTSLNPKNFDEGKQVGSEYIENIVSSLSLSLRESGYSPTTSKGIISRIEIGAQNNPKLATFFTRNGMKFEINKFEVRTTDKLLLAFERYNILHSQGIVDCTIEVHHSEIDDSLSYRIK